MTQNRPYDPILGLRAYDRQGNRILTIEELAKARAADTKISQTHYYINGDPRGILVSTVHLIIDHNFNYAENKPLIFETMVFCDTRSLPKLLYHLDELCLRTATEQEAFNTHQATCAKIEATLDHHNFEYVAIPG